MQTRLESTNDYSPHALVAPIKAIQQDFARASIPQDGSPRNVKDRNRYGQCDMTLFSRYRAVVAFVQDGEMLLWFLSF